MPKPEADWKDDDGAVSFVSTAVTARAAEAEAMLSWRSLQAVGAGFWLTDPPLLRYFLGTYGDTVQNPLHLRTISSNCMGPRQASICHRFCGIPICCMPKFDGAVWTVGV